jgi:DNA-binding HxlR family transcriptional regulator
VVMASEIESDDTEPTEVCNVRLAFVRGALLLQEKWVMMIVFDLLDGPRSFNQLMRKGSVNTTTLTQRLHLLENAGVLVKTVHSTMPPRTSYELTQAGLELREVFNAIQVWSERNLAPAGEAEVCGGNACSRDEDD